MEISHLLEMNEGGLVTFGRSESEGEQIRFWLSTPQGEVWGNPAWGNPYIDFKHESLDENLEVEIEFEFLSSLSRDLPHIDVSLIAVSAIGVQDFELKVITNKEEITETIRGNNETA